MSVRQRLTVCGWAATLLAGVSVLGWMVSWDRSPLDSIDRGGRSAEDFTDNHAVLASFLRAIELSFATVGMIVWTSVVIIVLLWRRRIKSAAWVLSVMVGTSLATSFLKVLLARGRPGWQDRTDLLSSKSFPSGHASSSAALAGMLIILVCLHVRSHYLRRAATVLLATIWLFVCLDRVMLGRHYPTDVIAGTALGVAAMLIGLVAFDPLTEAHHRDAGAPESRRELTGRTHP